ncbi:MAG: hypothetical protein A2Y79_13510 [Deltaproteobacteria bacterium RBG_13_43_22]|nr:MAG: hypothetical protein A2Y79_13510 [Deltaproteobacteria bacterium RBG_13_43_22]
MVIVQPVPVPDPPAELVVLLVPELLQERTPKKDRQVIIKTKHFSRIISQPFLFCGIIFFPLSNKRIQGFKGSRIQVKGLEIKTLESSFLPLTAPKGMRR